MKFGPVVLVGILIALAGTAVPALALTSITSCPANITQSGDYQLTADLACTVSISASNVSLKLNGHTVSPGPTNDGIDVIGAGRLDHVGIQGPGLITGAHVGITIQSNDYSQVALVTIKNSVGGIQALANSFLTVGSNVVGTSQVWGIYLSSCTSCVVSGNDLSGGFADGIIVESSIASTVNNNTASGNAGVGIRITGGTGTRVYGNVTNSNHVIGIRVEATGTQIFSNTSSLANGSLDLADTSPCFGNLWGNNVFQTANQTCIH